MAKKRNKAKETITSEISILSAVKSQRGDWGDVNPVTKIIPDKTKYNRKKKYKENYREDIND